MKRYLRSISGVAYMQRLIYILVLGLICWAGCKKAETTDKNDPRLTANSYCNDPRAVNYNWNFPGKVDNTTCFYPSDVFKGTYLFNDTILDATFFADSTLVSSYTITLTPVNNDYNKMLVHGLHICGPNGDDLPVYAGRFFKATVDSTRNTTDTTFLPGQVLANCADTVSGYFLKAYGDDATLRINLMVYNDTGVIYHVGTAKKQ